MRESTSTDYERMTSSKLFKSILATKGNIRACREREKGMLRNSHGVSYDKRMAKKKQEVIECLSKKLKERLKQDVGKKIFKRSIISIFKKDSEVFKRFLIENYDFDGWKDTYDSVVYKNAMKDSDAEIILNNNMHEKYIDYVIES